MAWGCRFAKNLPLRSVPGPTGPAPGGGHVQRCPASGAGNGAALQL